MSIRDLYPLSPPSNWQDFEDLCFLFFKARWRDPSAQKHGRQGQAQAGVDIYGCDRQGAFWGVQCKGKNQYPGGFLTKKTIVAEAKKALGFKPTLNRFAIAAAVLRDVAAQEAARVLTKENQGLGRFGVEVWSWEDIRDELYDYPQIIRRLYPGYFSDNALDRLVRLSDGAYRVDLFGADTLERIALTVDQIGGELGVNKSTWRLLRNVIVEMAANAFDHGGAGKVFITTDNYGLVIEDDGEAFDPLEPPRAVVANAGLKFLRYARRLLGGQASFDYVRGLENNRLRIAFEATAFRRLKMLRYTVDGAGLPWEPSEVRRAIAIPADVDEVVVNLTTMRGLAASTGYAVASEVAAQLLDHQKARLIVPEHFADFLMEEGLATGLSIEIGLD